MGIGLTAVHKVLIAMTKKFWLRSRAREGTAFCFSLGKRKVSKHGVKN